MKIKPAILTALMAAILVVSSHSVESAAQIKKVAIEEVLSIGSLDDEALFQWSGVAADADGFIYVLDAMDYSLKKFDQAGHLVKKAGRKGQGPGEFMAPRLLDCRGESLYATDQNTTGILVFDRELVFKKRIPYPLLLFNLRAVGENCLAVGSPVFQGPGKVVLIDEEGKVKSEMVFLEKPEGMLMDSMSMAIDPKGDFYIAFLFLDRIEKREKSGRLVWSQKLFGGKKVEKKTISSYVLPTETCYKDVALDRNGNVFVLGGGLSRHPSRDVYVLSPAGELLTTFMLPDTSHCLYIDSRNFLYSRANDGITLKKYRMIYH
jgi:hypothetical protein